MLQSNREVRLSPRMPESSGIHGKSLVWSGNSGNDWKCSGIIRKWLETTCTNFPFCLTVRQNGLGCSKPCLPCMNLSSEWLVCFYKAGLRPGGLCSTSFWSFLNALIVVEIESKDWHGFNLLWVSLIFSSLIWVSLIVSKCFPFSLSLEWMEFVSV